MSGINAYNGATGTYRAASAGSAGSAGNAGSAGSTGSSGSAGSYGSTATGSANGSFGDVGSTGSAGFPPFLDRERVSKLSATLNLHEEETSWFADKKGECFANNDYEGYSYYADAEQYSQTLADKARRDYFKYICGGE